MTTQAGERRSCPTGRRGSPCYGLATATVTRLRGDFEGTTRRFCAACALDATRGANAMEFAIV